MYLEPADVNVDMDPRLQQAVDRGRRGQLTRGTTSSEPDEIGVIARVTEPQAWEKIAQVRPGVTCGRLEDGYIVTGRVSLAKLEQVRTAPGVLSMKAAQKLRPSLHATIQEIEAAAGMLPPGQTSGGAGAIVGIVDFGGDFAHRAFRKPDGSTRMIALWDQNAGHDGGPQGYGTVHDRAAIDAALSASGDKYAALGYDPGSASHGTHVMDIAAGSGLGAGSPGVAPEADLLFVQPAVSDIAWEGEDAVGVEFGDSVQLLEALTFIFDAANGTPCAINVSLGTNGGPHDGTSLVEQGIDALLAGGPNRAVVIAASNSFEDGIHAGGTVAEGGTTDIGWEISGGSGQGAELEVWYAGADAFAVEILTPDGTSLGTVPLGASGRIQADDGTTLLFVSHRADDPNNHDNVFNMFLEQRVPDGTWTIRLHGERVTDGTFHAWIERNDAAQSSFSPPHDNSHTIGSISCGQLTLVAGSYDAHVAAAPLSWFSSAGPTRDGRMKPEISAPGHDVVAASSRSGQGVTKKSGTSMAAPAVTGVAALVLAEAAARGMQLDASAVRDVVIASARDEPPPANGWDPRYGNGRVSAAGALNALQAVPATGGGAAGA